MSLIDFSLLFQLSFYNLFFLSSSSQKVVPTFLSFDLFLQNKIPVFCPALTDGSLGDMLYFHSYKESGFIVDINQDIRKMNSIAVWAKKSGQIILGMGTFISLDILAIISLP